MTSLWTQTAKLPSFWPLTRDEHTDVLVIGGGIAGLLCAFRLQQAGLSVIVAEAGRLAQGTTAGTTAKLTVQHGGNFYSSLIERQGVAYAKQYRRAQEQALVWFDELATQFPCDAQTVDAVLYTREDTHALWREQTAIRLVGGEAERTEQPLPFPVKGALRLPRQRQFHPLKLLAGIAGELTVYERTRVVEVQEHSAITEEGVTITAKHIVVATHFPFINRRGLYPLKLYQNRSYVLALTGAPPLSAMLLDSAPDGLFLRQYGEYLLMSGLGHRTGTFGGGWKPLERVARQWFPKASVAGRWAAQDCCTADEVAYIGAYSSHAPTWSVATGFNGWGMSGSLVAAQVLTNRILGNAEQADTLFSPQRRVPAAPLWANAGESVKGLLTPTVPRCTHLGCALHWNPWEHSWDCACHGSRFGSGGQVLHGPAMQDLSNPPKQKQAGDK